MPETHPVPALPERLLLGPGPSNVPERVRRAQGAPMIGHLDPAFLAVLEEAKAALAELFGTRNRFTLPLSATGSAGMEACLVNLLEPGDRVVVGVHGVFGSRMCEVARRAGADVTAVEAPFGQALDPNAMREAIRAIKPRAVAFVHAETSTGVLQPVEEIAAAACDADALVILDCVTSLGGVSVALDEWGIDAAYSGTQKCLSCPPGLSPVSFSERALERVRARSHPVQSWYLDVTLLDGYYATGKRVYHHTAPISAILGLTEGLRIVLEEGLDARAQRHREAAGRLIAELEPLGFEPLVAEALRLPPLTTLRLPRAVTSRGEADVRARLLLHHGIEVGGGLGPLAGSIWRVGLMGENAHPECVDRLVTALRKELT